MGKLKAHYVGIFCLHCAWYGSASNCNISLHQVLIYFDSLLDAKIVAYAGRLFNFVKVLTS